MIDIYNQLVNHPYWLNLHIRTHVVQKAKHLTITVSFGISNYLTNY